MRILITQESDWLKRGPHDQHHLAEKLSLRGHEIRVIDFEILWKADGKKELFSRRQVFTNVSKIYNGGQVTVFRPSIVKTRVPGTDYLALLFFYRREIERQIEEFAPHVIVTLGILNSYLAMKAAKKSNIPLLYYWIDVLHLLIPIKYFRPLGKAIEGRILRQADVVLASNKSLRALVIGMGSPPERTHILEHGIDFKRFNPDLADGSTMRKRYAIKRDDIVITFVGRLSRLTGVIDVALELSKVDIPDLKFLVVGTGSREDELRQMQAKLGLQKKLIITGRRPYDEIPNLLAASDICLLPFHNVPLMRDIVPLKIFDYMAMKKPIISTKLPGMMEEFGENNGIVYVDRPGDTIKKAIELASQKNLQELGAKARELIQENSWDRSTDELERILSYTIEKKRSDSLT